MKQEQLHITVLYLISNLVIIALFLPQFEPNEGVSLLLFLIAALLIVVSFFTGWEMLNHLSDSLSETGQVAVLALVYLNPLLLLILTSEALIPDVMLSAIPLKTFSLVMLGLLELSMINDRETTKEAASSSECSIEIISH